MFSCYPSSILFFSFISFFGQEQKFNEKETRNTLEVWKILQNQRENKSREVGHPW